MVDPILGDDGALYVSNEVAEATKASLLPLATILKPNHFELEWLSGRSVATDTEALQAASSLGQAETVITSVPAPHGLTGNLVVTPSDAFITHTENLPIVPKGTGDLFGALYLSARLNQEPPSRALEMATNGIFAALGAPATPQKRQLALILAQESLIGSPHDFKAQKITGATP